MNFTIEKTTEEFINEINNELDEKIEFYDNRLENIDKLGECLKFNSSLKLCLSESEIENLDKLSEKLSKSLI